MKIVPAFLPIALLLVSFVQLGCSRNNAPADEEVAAFVRDRIPPYLKIRSVTFEPADANRQNFKVVATAQEPLFAAVQDDRGLGLKLLRQTQNDGEQVTLYGQFRAARVIDKWELSALNITSGLENIGDPKGSFPPGTPLAGSAEAAQLISATEARITRERREAEERRIAAARREAEEAERKRAAAEEVRARNAAATAAVRKRAAETLKAGAEFIGTVRYDQESEQMLLRVVEVTGSSITLECSHPVRKQRSSTWSGEIAAPKSPGDPVVVLSRTGGTVGGYYLDWFYGSSSATMQLTVAGDGVVTGVASGARFTVSPK